MKITTISGERDHVATQFSASINGTIYINFIDGASDMNPKIDSYALVELPREEAIAMLRNLQYMLSLGGPIS